MKKERIEKSVIEMVAKQIREDGADGLYNYDLECGCGVGDLAPCGGINEQCVAARHVKRRDVYVPINFREKKDKKMENKR